MSERRFDDQEVQEILERATVALPPRGQLSPSSLDGLTLAQLQEIGVEAGISPARIESAARELEVQASATPPATLMGVPRSVSRMVPLERAMRDEEWDRLVADLRQTFGAVGELSAHGSLRTWRNGNLQAHVEPHGEGWRLRMETLKGDAASMAGVGAMFGLMGLLILVLGILGEFQMKDVIVGSLFAMGGFGHLGYLRIALPHWADQRAAQMEGVAERVHLLMAP
ncbi:MAG: hypothetical protein WEA09_05665 [Gemmatimonadota bacterium]